MDPDTQKLQHLDYLSVDFNSLSIVRLATILFQISYSCECLAKLLISELFKIERFQLTPFKNIEIRPICVVNVLIKLPFY